MRPRNILFVVGTVLLCVGWWYLHPRSEPKALSSPQLVNSQAIRLSQTLRDTSNEVQQAQDSDLDFPAVKTDASTNRTKSTSPTRSTNSQAIRLSTVGDTLNEVQRTQDSDLDSVPAVKTDASTSPTRSTTIQKNSLIMDVVVLPYFKYNASENELLEREKEYMTVLQRNLNHDLVSHNHVLTANAEGTRQIFKKYKLSNQTKLLISEVKSIEMVRDIFDYISQNLVGKHVLFTNADIWLGGGFDQVDPIEMHKQKIMYSLTRRLAKGERCVKNKDLCLEEPYKGCHDTFLFYLNEAIPEYALKYLDVKFPAPGIEEVIMWVFQTKLKYCILNPCSILETFHFHCSGLRNHDGPGWKRVNNRYNSVHSIFTKKLVCR